jgi:phage host-nuclease inhibitor protein Gam
MGKSKTTNRSSLSSWQEVDEKLRVIAINKAFIARKEAEMNKRILEIQKKHEEETRESRDRVTASEKEIELFCQEHRDEFSEVKTKVLNYGLVSFRLTSPKLTTLKGFTWETALKLLKKLNMTNFIRVKEEIDKEAIKTQLSDDPKGLASVGLVITQSESFYYEVFEKEIV